MEDYKELITYQWQTSKGAIAQELMTLPAAREWMAGRNGSNLNAAFYQSLVLYKVTKTVKQERV